MNETASLLEKLVLGEVEGKNRAIHAYDGIVWKIRTGFLTLLFGGWAIMLRGVVDAQGKPGADYQPLAWGLFLFSLGFALGAWYVDRSYVRRKFRVILALDELMAVLHNSKGNVNALGYQLLQVAGDNADMPYKSKGYREAIRAEVSIYIIPLVILAMVIRLVVQKGG